MQLLLALNIKKDNLKTPQCYYSEILGHSEDDLNTCNSYFDFYLE